MKEHIIKNRDIVLFSFQPWDEEIGSNFKDIALELSRNNRVLFINHALDRISALTKRNQKKVRARLKSIWQGEGELTEVKPNLWVHNPRTVLESINWLPRGGAYDFMNRVNSKRLAKQINKIIHRLNFTNIILINDNDFFRCIHLKQMLNASVYLFYIRDYLTYQPWFRKHGVRMEQKMMRVADVVVANSGYLANYARKFNPLSFDIGQGCDVQQYLAEDLPIPADLKAIAHPIIGYAGAISGMRLDAEVIAHIAQQLQDCSIVLVGPVVDAFDEPMLRKYSNVHFLGRKDPSEVPSYVCHFDVCINPQQVNQLTIGNYPRKADEYLAMGKPVVATRTDAMEMFSEHVFLCNSKEEYVKYIKDILNSPELQSSACREQRQAFALTHTWENSVSLLGAAFYEFEKKQGKYAALEKA